MAVSGRFFTFSKQNQTFLKYFSRNGRIPIWGGMFLSIIMSKTSGFLPALSGNQTFSCITGRCWHSFAIIVIHGGEKRGFCHHNIVTIYFVSCICDTILTDILRNNIVKSRADLCYCDWTWMLQHRHILINFLVSLSSAPL